MSFLRRKIPSLFTLFFAATIFGGCAPDIQTELTISAAESLTSNPTPTPTTTSTPTPTCSPGRYWNSGTNSCQPAGVGKWASGLSGSAVACTNAPSFSNYIYQLNSTSSCSWYCGDGYIAAGNAGCSPSNTCLMDYSSSGWSCAASTNTKSMACNHNEVMVGFYGASGWVINQYGIICQSIKSDGTLDPTSSYNNTTTVNTTAGATTFTLQCPAGKAVSQVLGYNLVWASPQTATGQLRITCKDFPAGTNPTSVGPVGGSMNSGGVVTTNWPMNFTCASGHFGIGMNFTAFTSTYSGITNYMICQ